MLHQKTFNYSNWSEQEDLSMNTMRILKFGISNKWRTLCFRLFNHLRSELLTREAASTGDSTISLTSQVGLQIHSLASQVEPQLQIGLQRHSFVFCERPHGSINISKTVSIGGFWWGESSNLATKSFGWKSVKFDSFPAKNWSKPFQGFDGIWLVNCQIWQFCSHKLVAKACVVYCCLDSLDAAQREWRERTTAPTPHIHAYQQNMHTSRTCIQAKQIYK